MHGFLFLDNPLPLLYNYYKTYCIGGIPMFNTAQLKAAAKQQIQGSVLTLFMYGLLAAVITFVPTFIVSYLLPALPGAEFTLNPDPGLYTPDSFSPVMFALNQFFSYAVQAVLGAAFTISMAMLYLNLTRGQRPWAADVFKGFRIFGKALGLQLLTSLFTFLWMLLFIIPGLVMSIAYSMAPYILAENPEMRPMEAIRASKKLTMGYKLDLFILNLSFLGWILLGILTLGFGFIYVGPYISATRANAYLKLKAIAGIDGSEEAQAAALTE